ncbi:MAG: DUF4129 domain-containing protein [Planctomycetes bacterium]|jgi:hypothetical protein|nr:DUF4129 domain-containing protein [Planctomycetota bacterium]
MTQRINSVLRCLLLLLVVLLAPLSAAESDPAREVLRTQKPPWYDATRDDWNRIAAKAPEPTTSASDRPGWLSGLSALFSWLMVAAAVTATVWLIYLLVRNLASERGEPVAAERRAAVARAVADLSALPFADAQSAKDPEAALDRAIAERDWRRAVAWSYALHLVELDHAGALHVGKGTTNRGYLRMLAAWAGERASRATLPPLLRDAVETFERTWFGHHPADQTLVQSLELGRTRLHEELAREQPA